MVILKKKKGKSKSRDADREVKSSVVWLEKVKLTGATNDTIIRNKR